MKVRAVGMWMDPKDPRESQSPDQSLSYASTVTPKKKKD